MSNGYDTDAWRELYKYKLMLAIASIKAVVRSGQGLKHSAFLLTICNCAHYLFYLRTSAKSSRDKICSYYIWIYLQYFNMGSKQTGTFNVFISPLLLFLYWDMNSHTSRVSKLGSTYSEFSCSEGVESVIIWHKC